MSPHFPAVAAKQVLKVLLQIGFVIDRTTGSHYILRRESDRRQTVVPVHGNLILKRKTLKSILTGAGLTLQEFEQLRKD
jgi:predicted RNA binding protein YcfA (HicA-like mRNA interferase family)